MLLEFIIVNTLVSFHSLSKESKSISKLKCIYLFYLFDKFNAQCSSTHNSKDHFYMFLTPGGLRCYLNDIKALTLKPVFCSHCFSFDLHSTSSLLCLTTSFLKSLTANHLFLILLQICISDSQLSSSSPPRIIILCNSILTPSCILSLSSSHLHPWTVFSCCSQ